MLYSPAESSLVPLFTGLCLRSWEVSASPGLGNSAAVHENQSCKSLFGTTRAVSPALYLFPAGKSGQWSRLAQLLWHIFLKHFKYCFVHCVAGLGKSFSCSQSLMAGEAETIWKWKERSWCRKPKHISLPKKGEIKLQDMLFTHCWEAWLVRILLARK